MKEIAAMIVLGGMLASGCQSPTDRYYQQKMDDEARDAKHSLNMESHTATTDQIFCYRAFTKNPKAYKRAIQRHDTDYELHSCVADELGYLNTWGDKGAYVKRLAAMSDQQVEQEMMKDDIQ
jgi:hypothetical protein